MLRQSESQRKRSRGASGRERVYGWEDHVPPHTRVFFAKSVELHENKWVEFLICAKKCKRVWNSLKRKDLNIVGSDKWRVANSGVARMTPTPPQIRGVLVSADYKGVAGGGSWKCGL